ncbi:beta-galactosidase [Salana multivorans]
MTVVGQRVDGAVEGGARISRAGLVLDGKEEVLLCASLFYFRIPRELWAPRLRQVRASGYRAIDVYLPWNFHETAPGVWDFDGRRDVAAFLDLAQEAGLVVVARPGPYICSEWDGGGLPAWLGTVPGLGVRQNEPLFLDAVRTWFDRVLPILAERQHGRGGSVLAVQIENELDFFDCHDRRGYQSALRDLVRAHGLTVPIIACAGQGDLAGATGDADGVVPACNFYPDDSSPHLEPEVRRYRRLLAERDLPLLVTETNRAHATLRRLLASGAALIAPYLQASGYNLGFTPSVGNWGDPAGLMAHDYDFGGYLSPVGEVRPEMADARVLAALIRLLGADLARGLPEPAVGAYRATCRTSESPSRMRLASGGSLLAVPNLTDDDAEVSFTRDARTVRAVLPGRTCLLVLEDLSLTRWGGPGSIELATADLLAVDGARLTLASSAGSILVLRDDHGERVVAELGAPAPGHPVEQVLGTAESTWVVTVLHPSDVAGPDVPSPSSVDDAADSDAAAGHETDDDERPAVQTVRAGAPGPLPPAQRHERAPRSEEIGVWRGRTHYATSHAGASRVLLTGAGDIVDVTLETAAGPRHRTLVPYGAPVLLDTAGADRLELTAETWGHANFDDARLPNLALGSLRGLGGAWRVLEEAEVSSLWALSSPSGLSAVESVQ